MGLALFGLTYLGTLLAAAGIAVYGFGFVEAMWGKGGSFQVLAMMSFVAAFVATIAFGISAALTRRFGGNTRSALLGFVAAAVTTISAYALSQYTGTVGTGGSILLTVVLAALAAAGNPRAVARRTSTRSLEILNRDLVTSVEIDPEGRLHVAPASRVFPYAYREAMEVFWDAQRRTLHSPPPRDWSYVRWLQQIVNLAAAQGVELVFHPGTSWDKVPPALRRQLLEAVGNDA